MEVQIVEFNITSVFSFRKERDKLQQMKAVSLAGVVTIVPVDSAAWKFWKRRVQKSVYYNISD